MNDNTIDLKGRRERFQAAQRASINGTREERISGTAYGFGYLAGIEEAKSNLFDLRWMFLTIGMVIGAALVFFIERLP